MVSALVSARLQAGRASSRSEPDPHFLPARLSPFSYTGAMEGSKQQESVARSRWYARFAPSKDVPADRELRLRRRVILIAAGLGFSALCWLLGLSSGFVESVYANGIGSALAGVLGWISGLAPGSMAEVAVIFTLGFWLVVASRGLWQVARRRRRLLNALACGALSFAAFASIAVALFYGVWGINYFRAPLIERSGWQAYAEPPASRAEQVLELREVCAELVAATNYEYVSAMGSSDVGTPSFSFKELPYLDASIEQAFARVQAELDLEPAFAKPRARAKPVAASVLMDYLQIGGFYFPWTGEANYNRNQPACALPFVIAHEKAHQRAVTSEDEANFFGFAACILSDDPYVRYSGYLFAQRQLLSELVSLDREAALELVKQRYRGVQRDVDDLRDYWQRLQSGVSGAVGEASAAVNHAYLTANRVEGGIGSYRMSSKLLIVYYRRQGTERLD